MDWIADPQAWIALGTLTAMEVVLGIDNVVFISILAGKLPSEQQSKARFMGLLLAMFMRIALLASIAWLVKLTAPLFTLVGHSFSGRDLILITGGMFLIAKSTHEIHNKLEGETGQGERGLKATFASVIFQIVLLDIVFSLDSVITAVGMVDQIGVMIVAIVVAVAFMMLFAGPISRFVDTHPTVKILALSFLLLIGVVLVADGLGQHVSKGYIYFAMGFAVFVEALNLRARRRSPVQLHERFTRDESVEVPR
jgi:predicted tellurium resistance membrane protein TerC